MAWLSSSSLCQNKRDVNERDVRECYERERERLREKSVLSCKPCNISYSESLASVPRGAGRLCVVFSILCARVDLAVC